MMWQPIYLYNRTDYDWVLLRHCEDGREQLPVVAERSSDGVWHDSHGFRIPFEPEFFFDMQELDEDAGRITSEIDGNPIHTSNRPVIEIKYLSDIEPVQALSVGDWIDLRAAEDVHMDAGEYKLIPLGVAMKLPEGYEAHVVPRSSTFKNFGIIQTNSMGVIDNSYCGDNDQWHFPVYALRSTVIHKNDRICQFRIEKIQPKIEFCEVEHLSDKNRGGIGSTGVK